MSKLNRLFDLASQALDKGTRRTSLTPPSASDVSPADRAAIARYDYLLQTADPHQIEVIHREAFERLTPEQRALVERRMQTELPPHERPRSASARDLARAAGRTEATSPGRLRGLLSRAGRAGAVVGAGSAVVGVLGAVAGGAILSSVAGPLLQQAAGWGVDFDALAEGVDVESIAGDALNGVGDAVGGVGEQVGTWGEQLGGFEIPGWGDFFGR
jgi:hypothetical protein